jgi:hypothetical protein
MRRFITTRGDRIIGYREMLEGDFRAIPDLYFDIHLLISEPPRVASRLRFDCTPKGSGLASMQTERESRSPKAYSMSFDTNGSKKYDWS